MQRRVFDSAFLAAFAIALVNWSSVAAERWESWPEQPIEISRVEGVIESFWLTRVQSLRRWKADGGELAAGWDATYFHLTAKTASMTRAYAIDLADYQRLIVRLTPGQSLRTTATAVLDGRSQTLGKDRGGSNRVLELAGPINGKKLSQLTLRFTANEPGECKVRLRWVMLDKPGTSWEPPENPLKGMIAEQPVNRFEPGLGIILGADELRRMRETLKDIQARNVVLAGRHSQVHCSAK